MLQRDFPEGKNVLLNCDLVENRGAARTKRQGMPETNILLKFTPEIWKLAFYYIFAL